MTATLPNTWTDKGMQNEAFHGAIIFVKDSDYESGFSVYDIYQTATLNRLLEVTAEDGFWYVGAKVMDFVTGEEREVHAIHYYAPRL